MKPPLLFLLLTSVLGCATPQPPDVPVFENLASHLGADPLTGHTVLRPSPACLAVIQESECGHGVYIMSGKQVYVGELPAHLLNGKKWSELRRQSVYVPAKESYAPISTYIINSCEKMGCNDQVTRFKVKLDSLNGIGAVLK